MLPGAFAAAVAEAFVSILVAWPFSLFVASGLKNKPGLACSGEVVLARA